LCPTVGEFAVGEFVGEVVVITGAAGVGALVGTEVFAGALDSPLTHSTFPLISYQLPSDRPAYWSWTNQVYGGLPSWFSKK